MYSLIIVEDEIRIRKSMISSIDWKSLGFQVVAQASNGKEALDIISKTAIDCVLTDVRMPIMDGLELAQILSNDYPEIKTIILSGYSDFDFVRSALQSKVFDYLLKPTDIILFKEAFVRLKHSLDLMQINKFDSLDYISIRQNDFQCKRNSFLLKLLDGNLDSTGTVLDEIVYFELDTSAPGYLVVDIQIELNKLHEFDAKDFVLSDQLSSIPEISQNALIVDKNKCESILVFPLDDKLQNPQKILLDFTQLAIDKLNMNPVVANAYAGIGNEVPVFLQIQDSYQQAKSVLEERFYTQDTCVFSYSILKKESSSHPMWPENFIYQMNSIVSAVISGDDSSCLDKIRSIFDWFRSNRISPDFVKQYCRTLLFLIIYSIPNYQNKYNPSKLLDELNTKDKTIYENTLENMQNLLFSYIEKLCNSASLFQNSEQVVEKQRFITSVKNYLTANFYRDISLNELSERFHYSTQYISFLFKHVTGENYVDFVRRLRMEKAIEYLKSGEFKVYEIAHLVGYKDYRYFSLQFKKVYGISPKRYVENNLENL